MQRLCSTISPSVSGEICVGRFRMKNSTLLCVDDDLGILEFYETMLGSNGYHVLLAQDGRQALAVFQEKVKEIDAVISDYEMPGVNGIELAAELKRYNSSLPVIMISGCLPLLDNIRHKRRHSAFERRSRRGNPCPNRILALPQAGSERVLHFLK